MSAKLKPVVLKPLPGELTPSVIREAVLPIKVAGMRRALAACTELPELLNYKRTIDGLAAAARTIKHEIPEMVKDMNRLEKEALIKMGQLLLQYSDYSQAIPAATRSPKGQAIKGGGGGSLKSDRRKVADSLGINPNTVVRTVRIASAPKDCLEQILASPRRDLALLATMAPVRQTKGYKTPPHSDAMRRVVGGPMNSRGLNVAVANLKYVDLDAFDALTPEERKSVKAKIVEAQELLDAMDQRLSRRAEHAA
jgi:hypothetical protein